VSFEMGAQMAKEAAASKPDALREFAASMAAGSRSARCYVEYGRLETDSGLAMAALHKAAELNRKLAEPHFLLAARETEAAKRIAELKLATTLDPRRLPYWQALAEAYIAQGDFAGAAKAWTAAEQAASNDADRARMRQARASIEQQRLDYEAARRKREAEENARELDKLKAEARAEVRALEAKANQGAPPPRQGEKVVPWWDGPKPGGTVRGNLKQVDCLGKQLRLVVVADGGKTVRLLVPDPSRISLLGAGELSLGCGPQQKPRRVSIEYFPKPNSKLATAGEVATIEFQ
jgi:tetratricopeptide (TPR) repeat protein